MYNVYNVYIHLPSVYDPLGQSTHAPLLLYFPAIQAMQVPSAEIPSPVGHALHALFETCLKMRKLLRNARNYELVIDITIIQHN